MASLTAVLIDDERAARRYLAQLLAACGDVTVVGSCATTDDADAIVTELQPDVLFIDVDLGGTENEGLHWLSRQSPRWTTRAGTRPAVVLATAHAEHALAAFDLGVTDYLLKPWSLDRVAASVERLKAMGVAPPSTNTPDRLVARRGRALRLVPLDEVLALQSDNRLAYLHTRGERLDLDLTLAVMERTFPALLRVHRAWLVHPAQVVELVQGDLGLELHVGPERLVVPVAQERMRAVRDKLLSGAIGLRRT
jgi:DNA-binding LytR/AlgR family response regulator